MNNVVLAVDSYKRKKLQHLLQSKTEDAYRRTVGLWHNSHKVPVRSYQSVSMPLLDHDDTLQSSHLNFMYIHDP